MKKVLLFAAVSAAFVTVLSSCKTTEKSVVGVYATASTTIHLNADNTYSYAQRWRDASGPQSNICTGKWSYRAATEWVVFDTQCADVIAPTDLEKQRQDGSRYFVAKANKLTRLVDTKQNKGASVYKKTKG